MKEPSRKGIPASSCLCSAPCLLPSAALCHPPVPHDPAMLPPVPVPAASQPWWLFPDKENHFSYFFFTILPNAGHTLLGEIANKGFSWINQNLFFALF